jgi:N-acetylglucosamine kinase-like BadF-type ATPase
VSNINKLVQEAIDWKKAGKTAAKIGAAGAGLGLAGYGAYQSHKNAGDIKTTNAQITMNRDDFIRHLQSK